MNDLEMGLLRQALNYHGRSETKYRNVFFNGQKRMYVTPADPQEFIAEGDVGFDLLRDAIAFVNSKPVSIEEKRDGRKGSVLDSFTEESLKKLNQWHNDKVFSAGREKARIERIRRDHEHHVWFHREADVVPQFQADERLFKGMTPVDRERLIKLALG
ncbi:MAG: hypothetical protein M0Z78_08900 [Betaproteobacteria bacterium]|nr:hypothetical protein [Betaproteobacteria bacterium]